MTSPLPPRRRDSRDLASLIRQSRTNARQLGVGFADGRFPPIRQLGATALYGDNEDDTADDVIGFINTDRATASGPGPVTFNLTHTPIDGSLHIRWNGIDQPASEWALNEATVTIPDPTSVIESGDVFTAAYAYLLEADESGLDWSLVGVTTVVGDTTSVALPAGTQDGDLLIFASAAATSATASDGRLTGTIGTSYGPGALLKWGRANGSGSPISCSISGGVFGYGATLLAVYRGVQVNDFGVNITATNVNDITLPVKTDSVAAVGVLLAFDGVVAGFINDDTTGNWTLDGVVDSTKTHVRLVEWHPEDIGDTPPGAFHHSGDWNGFLAATLKLEAAS